jgi:hypothetical protein
MMTAHLCGESSSRADHVLASNASFAPNAMFPVDPAEISAEGLEKEWRIRLQSLQEWVCLLLTKNQQLRMELMEAKAKLLMRDDESRA